MKVHFSINWSKTELYNAGKRDLTINWNQGEGFPREGEAINIPKFIGANYQPNELFKNNGTESNVFDWIQTVSGWEVRKVMWDQEDKNAFIHILVGDKE